MRSSALLLALTACVPMGGESTEYLFVGATDGCTEMPFLGEEYLDRVRVAPNGPGEVWVELSAVLDTRATVSGGQAEFDAFADQLATETGVTARMGGVLTFGDETSNARLELFPVTVDDFPCEFTIEGELIPF